VNIQTLFIDKTSDTAADTLLAVGMGRLVRETLQQCGKRSRGVVLADCGPYYELQLPVALTTEDARKIEPFSLVRPLLNERIKKQKGLRDGFDYQQAVKIYNAYYARLKDMPPACRHPEARLNKSLCPMLEELQEPPDELAHYQAINQMKIADSFNALALRWLELGPWQHEHILLLLDLFREPGNNLAAALNAWQKLAKEHRLPGKALVTQLQIVNPVAGKGANRTKPGMISEGNPDNFWLLELLKFVGFMEAAAPYTIREGKDRKQKSREKQKKKDRKTYVLLPREVDLSLLDTIMKTFRAVCWPSTAVKMDVLASLRFAQVFIALREQALEGQQTKEEDFLVEPQLYSIAQGFEVTSYKNMGNAYATMNVATIDLPWWLDSLETLDGARQAGALVREHLAIIQGLRNSKGEEGSEEHELLRYYRDFLSGRNLRPFWAFTAAYSGYLISQREREKDPGKQLRAFTIDGLEALLMSGEKKLTTITSNPGFRHIASAIRQATIKAQYRKAQLRNSGLTIYDVRYGLGQELVREAHYKEKFIAALAEFIHEYNAETARTEEKVAIRLGHKLTASDRKANGLRFPVLESDLDEIVALTDTFDSDIVCKLLVAYGYASEGPRPGKQEEGETAADTFENDIPELEELPVVTE
jgi:hypothetical protein